MAETRGQERTKAPARRERRRQADRSAESEKGILRAALELISERGFRATSLAAIGERAGYSSALVSHRFGSKEGVLRELAQRLIHRWSADMREPAVGQRAGTEALQAAAHAHRQAIEQKPESIRALYMLLFESLADMPELRRDIAGLDKALRQRIERRLSAGIAAGTIRANLDVAAQAVLFLAALRGVTLQWLVEPEALDLERVYRALDAWLESGLSP